PRVATRARPVRAPQARAARREPRRARASPRSGSTRLLHGGPLHTGAEFLEIPDVDHRLGGFVVGAVEAVVIRANGHQESVPGGQLLVDRNLLGSMAPAVQLEAVAR